VTQEDLIRARQIFMECLGNSFGIWKEGYHEEFESYDIPKKVQQEWGRELVGNYQKSFSEAAGFEEQFDAFCYLHELVSSYGSGDDYEQLKEFFAVGQKSRDDFANYLLAKSLLPLTQKFNDREMYDLLVEVLQKMLIFPISIADEHEYKKLEMSDEEQENRIRANISDFLKKNQWKEDLIPQYRKNLLKERRVSEQQHWFSELIEVASWHRRGDIYQFLKDFFLKKEKRDDFTKYLLARKLLPLTREFNDRRMYGALVRILQEMLVKPITISKEYVRYEEPEDQREKEIRTDIVRLLRDYSWEEGLYEAKELDFSKPRQFSNGEWREERNFLRDLMEKADSGEFVALPPTEEDLSLSCRRRRFVIKSLPEMIFGYRFNEPLKNWIWEICSEESNFRSDEPSANLFADKIFSEVQDYESFIRYLGLASQSGLLEYIPNLKALYSDVYLFRYKKEIWGLSLADGLRESCWRKLEPWQKEYYLQIKGIEDKGSDVGPGNVGTLLITLLVSAIFFVGLFSILKILFKMLKG
jgi:hypothetical protein